MQPLVKKALRSGRQSTGEPRPVPQKAQSEKTPEPFGTSAASSDRPRFVVQRHAARSLHYDFRLERDGALASWAVPKGVPLRRGERHLAVHVEDHPLDYADFEGVIPAGEYGAGTVEIWDKGTYELVEEKRDGGLTVRLRGERLDGVWTLVPASLDGKEKNWLILRKDAGTRRGRALRADARRRLGDGADRRGLGVRAEVGRLPRDRDRVRGRRDVHEPKRQRPDGPIPRRRPCSKPRDRVVRTPCSTARSARSTTQGRSRFSLLQEAAGTPVLVLYDLLELEGEPLSDEPLTERRKKLERLVPAAAGVIVSPQFDDGPALLAAARAQELEGVVAKQADSPYRPGRRSPDWHKVKLRQTQEVVIAGYTRGQGRRVGGFGALVARGTGRGCPALGRKRRDGILRRRDRRLS